ncbi:MAG: FecR domain-containing protein [Legionella sp.]
MQWSNLQLLYYLLKKVVAKPNGVELALTRCAALEAGDEIVTAAYALANIQYTNGALVNIGSDTNYKILAYAPKGSVQIKAELNHGNIEVKTAEKIKESLKTPILSLAILGTDVKVFVPSAKMTYVDVIEGLVSARNEYLRPGKSILATSHRMIHAPFPPEGKVEQPKSTIYSTSTTTTRTGASVSGGGAYAVSYTSVAQLPGTTTVSAAAGAQTAVIGTLEILSCVSVGHSS